MPRQKGTKESCHTPVELKDIKEQSWKKGLKGQWEKSQEEDGEEEEEKEEEEEEEEGLEEKEVKEEEEEEAGDLGGIRIRNGSECGYPNFAVVGRGRRLLCARKH